MITILTGDLPAACFSSEIPDIAFSLHSERYLAAVRMLILTDESSETIYTERLHPVDGIVRLRGLSRYIDVYLRECLKCQLEIVIEEYFSETVIDTCRLTAEVYYCGVRPVMPAVDFFRERFLSACQDVRQTSLLRREVLYFLGTELPTVTVLYDTGATMSHVVKPDVMPVTGYRRIDVSPSRFATPDGIHNPVSYTVQAGERKQIYEVDSRRRQPVPALSFVNCFGVVEYAYCTGTQETEAKMDRSLYESDGIQRAYKITEQRTMQANTGVIDISSTELWCDLLRSYDVRLMDRKSGKWEDAGAVVVSDEKSKWTSADDELVRLTFSYRMADGAFPVVDMRSRGRVFDATFDETFN